MFFKKYRSVKKRFQLFLPPFVGYSFIFLLRLLFTNKVSFRYLLRSFIIVLISFIGIPFRVYEYWRTKNMLAGRKLPESPIFIIGHWRSGTTYLHNILCQDPQMGYVTTYQSVFPENMFRGFGKWLFKSFMKIAIPVSRKGDNVKLGVEYPQEEEFALGCKHNCSFYHFWFFPEKTLDYYMQYVLFEGNSQRTKNNFVKAYNRLIIKALVYHKKDIFISKNPPNTGRIPVLLEMYPNARFIHIYRNPVTVILSTRNFFEMMMPYLQFHSIDKEVLENNIFMIHENMMQKMFEDISLIPSDNLVEINFEEFEQDPFPIIENIYDQLRIPDFEYAKDNFKSYILSRKGFQKNNYSITASELEHIKKRCFFTMKKWGYGTPDNIDIIS